jgi:hypothetical protein
MTADKYGESGVFAELVTSQDQGASVQTSRHLIAQRFALPIEQVVAIEREGPTNEWAPPVLTVAVDRPVG